MTVSFKQLLRQGVLSDNPVYRQVLGICSALAVTNLVKNTLFMCFGVTFTTALSSMTISLMRDYIPQRVRMVVQVIIIASYVMVVDVLIKAVSPDIHVFIGPYVGLIITNCVIMGRAEAFASYNNPLRSFLDGISCGLGYSAALLSIAIVREIMGFGSLLGYSLPFRDFWWHQWTIMIMPPGAFFMLSLATWFVQSRVKTSDSDNG